MNTVFDEDYALIFLNEKERFTFHCVILYFLIHGVHPGMRKRWIYPFNVKK
jgi:hypothetical protein